MTTEKAINYTDEQETQMREVYAAAQDDAARRVAVEKLAVELGKSKQSIVGKLVKMNIYVKPTRTDKTGGPVTKKEEYITALYALTAAREGVLDSLEKANKTTLKFLTEFLVNLSDRMDADK